MQKCTTLLQTLCVISVTLDSKLTRSRHNNKEHYTLLFSFCKGKYSKITIALWDPTVCFKGCVAFGINTIECNVEHGWNPMCL